MARGVPRWWSGALVAAGCMAGLRPNARLELRCSVPAARLYINEQLIGRCAELEHLRLVPGTHRLEARADGYFTAYREVVANPERSTSVVIELRPLVDGEPDG